ncbi:hypothetical protein CEXT_228861 [Caerostris extrusa]|uniref:Uncharacterized protein n=1 Tax=Caerostris extrusa TaxID=172846 RepID=A0AAV4NUG9_CAEEX|nr:hypothetical protein CEXT_228861 [Caerostris extrusa]
MIFVFGLFFGFNTSRCNLQRKYVQTRDILSDTENYDYLRKIPRCLDRIVLHWKLIDSYHKIAVYKESLFEF